MSSVPPRPLSELVFLARGPLALRALAVIAAAVLTGAVGVLAYRLQHHFAQQRAAGGTLSSVQALLASGSGPRSAWIGWAAAACFSIAALRVRRGPLEPSAGRRPVEALTPAQLRSGLRREYTVVRVLLVVVLLAAAADSARAITLAMAGPVQNGSLLWTALEAGGLIVAAVTLALWAWWFGADLRRINAI